MCATEQPGHSLRLLAAAQRLRDARHTPLAPSDRDLAERAESAARALLDAPAAAEEWQTGSDWTVGEAIDVAIGTVVTAGPRDGLTARERDVVRLVARGMSNREIADQLVVSVRTAEAHVTNALGKLGLRSRAQLAVWATEHGLL